MTVMSLSRDLKDDLHSDTVLSILNEQRIRGILCDVTIIVEDTKFKAHSNVLAASSLYFKNIFWSHTICISSHVLELDDLKAEVFTEILNYIYSSTVVVRTQETVTDLAAAGRKLGIAFLEDLSDRSFAGSPSPYVFCITEKGAVKEEKNERRPEEPATMNGPRITNAFSIIETENSNSMFSPLDLRASFKKMSDSVRTAGLCLERTDVCHEAEPVRTLAEHSYAVSSIPEPYRGQASREQGRASPDKAGGDLQVGPAAQPGTCPKPKTLSTPQDPAPAPEDRAAPPVTGPPQAHRERSPPPAAALPQAKPPDQEDGPPAREDGTAAARPLPDRAGPPAAQVPPLVYNCSCCAQSFDSSALLSAHMQLHRPTQEPLVCKHCNKQFTTLNRLDRHERICMRAGPLPAAGEDASFLEKYPTIGQNGGSFPAPETLLGQRRPRELAGPGGALPEADHLVKFVDGQMLYSCAVCKRSYVTLSSLRRHANVHSWRRTYPCHYCNKVFALAEYRTRHEIWHTGERRYQCIFCLETFMTYYILKNHQKSFHAIDHRLSISKKTANGGLKPAVYPYKLYRLLPMKCKRAPLKGFRCAPYEGSGGAGPAPEAAPEAAPQDAGGKAGALGAALGTPAGRGPAASPAGPQREGPARGGDTSAADPRGPGHPGEEPVPPAEEEAAGLDPREKPASVISYGAPAPSVIVHGRQFSSVITHGTAAAAVARGGPAVPSEPAASQPPEDASRAELERGTRPAGRPKVPREKKKSPPSSRAEPAEGAPGGQADPGGAQGAAAEPGAKTGKTETYIAKPALPGASADSSVAPLCQITVRIGSEAIVKRHILGSKLFCRRGRRPRPEAPERGDSPPGPGHAEGADAGEAFEDAASDHDSTDKPWRPYYNYKPKKKSRQLRKMRKITWRKEPAPRSSGGGGRCRSPAELDRAPGQRAPERAPEDAESQEMPRLQCELCHGGRAAEAGGQGRAHQHLAPRPHVCELCAKPFQSPSTLRMHMRCHTGEKPYACQTCGRRFSIQGNLQKHERIHLGLKEFICRYCSKAFTLNETLKIHERIHTGEKRYHCQFCLQGFLYLSTKRNHERRHVREHDGKGFACFQCPKICKTAAALGMHQKKHLFKTPARTERTGDPDPRESPGHRDPGDGARTPC
ncbi:zinc finger and BTB domain-containing protein 38 isoform 1-T9 [Thomomys bottae]